MTPSIKGSLFVRAVEDILKLLASRTLSRGELQRRLRADDIALLDQPVLTSGWYDVQAYSRFLELLRDVEGEGKNEYLRQRGTRSAELLLQAGLYQQMEYLSRTQVSQEKDPQARFLAFGRDLRLLTTLHKSILNFAQQQAKIDPERADRYVIEFTDAAAFPEALCWTTDGFINRMARGHKTPDLWTWKRSRPDVILYRMTRSL